MNPQVDTFIRNKSQHYFSKVKKLQEETIVSQLQLVPIISAEDIPVHFKIKLAQLTGGALLLVFVSFLHATFVFSFTCFGFRQVYFFTEPKLETLSDSKTWWI